MQQAANLLSQIEHYVPRVEQLITATLQTSSEDYLPKIILEHLQTGGKRLRVKMALAAAKMLGVDMDQAIVWASACELLHNATLIHDDVQDGDTIRRGKKTVWANHGIAQAINAGDLLFVLPFSILKTHHLEKSGLGGILADHALKVIHGQARELNLQQEATPSWEHYEHAVKGKTSALFECAVAGAAALAGKNNDEIQRLVKPFGLLGLVFQIRDDIMDLYGDKERLEQGNDIKEGKISALVSIYSAQPNANWDALKFILRKPRQDTHLEDIIWVKQEFSNTYTLQILLERIKQYNQQIMSVDDNPLMILFSELLQMLPIELSNLI